MGSNGANAFTGVRKDAPVSLSQATPLCSAGEAREPHCSWSSEGSLGILWSLLGFRTRFGLYLGREERPPILGNSGTLARRQLAGLP